MYCKILYHVHSGHIKYLQEAKLQGHRLIVAFNSDTPVS